MQCKAKKLSGDPCGGFAMDGGDYCFTHDPANGSQRAAARKRGGLHRRVGHIGDTSTLPGKIRTLEDVLAILDYTLAESLGLENSIARGRLLVSIAAEYTNAIKTGELENRLAALEAALRIRGDK